MRRINSIVIGVTFLISLFVCSNEAFASVRRVPQTYATIQGAINAATAGDVILVSPGLYQENLNISKPIALKSVSGSPADTAIKGVDLQRATINVHDVAAAADIVIIAGFYIYNSGQDFSIPSDSGIFVKDVNDIRIYNNWIGYNKRSGIHFYRNVKKFDIRKNLIMKNTANISAGAGIEIGTQPSTTTNSTGSISNNIIAFNRVKNYGGGILLSTTDAYPLSISLINNTIVFNSGTNWVSFGAGIFVDAVRPFTPVLKNNIIWGNRRDGSSERLFFMNICGWSAGVIDPTCPLFTYNDIEGMSSVAYLLTNIDAAPLFKNISPSAPDLRLRIGSPCLNVGDPIDDNSNEPIPNGGRIDMGAGGNTAFAGGY